MHIYVLVCESRVYRDILWLFDLHPRLLTGLHLTSVSFRTRQRSYARSTHFWLQMLSYKFDVSALAEGCDMAALPGLAADTKGTSTCLPPFAIQHRTDRQSD